MRHRYVQVWREKRVSSWYEAHLCLRSTGTNLRRLERLSLMMAGSKQVLTSPLLLDFLFTHTSALFMHTHINTHSLGGSEF